MGTAAPKPANSGAVDDEAVEIKLVAPRRPPKDAKTPLKPIADVAGEVDKVIERDLAEMHLEPEELCDDVTFLRRVSLDLTGQIPASADISAFMNRPPNLRRGSTIDELIKSREYAERWVSFWMAALLGGERQFTDPEAAVLLRQWLHQHLLNNTPYDAWVEQLLTAYGTLPFTNNNLYRSQDGTPRTPAIVYLGHHLQEKGLPETVGHVTRTFLGMRMGCAQCHDHPFDKWTQQDFWKLTAYFSYTAGSERNLNDTDTRITGGTFEPPEPSLLLDPALPGMARSTVADNTPPKPVQQKGTPRNYTGQPVAGGKDKVETKGLLYRKELAQWIVGGDNANFDRVAVNRIWQALLGQGFVEPVDDLRDKNPPTHPEALQILADDFRMSGRDLRRLIAIVANTRAYQRSSFGTSTGKDRLMAVRYAARADVRPMTPEMVFCAVLKSANGGTKAKVFLEGLRHSQAYNARNGNSDVAEFYALLQQFHAEGEGQPAVASVEFQGTVTLALMMMHAPIIQRMLRGGTGSRSVDKLFADTLCRQPTPDERIEVAKLKGGSDDLLWVLINSAEFVTIH